MATYTPNLNLGKPEVTDAFGNFRQLFNDNMDILDNGGGGGSGGHTIVNPSGTDMPAEGKLQFTGGVTVTDDSVNGKTVVDISGGGGNVYGAFIDTNHLITSGQYSSGSPLSYTATEDCFVYGVCTLTNNTSGSVSIDGVQVGGWYNGGGTTAYNFGFLVKNGQTITASQTFSGNSDYKVYGVTQGTNGIFTPIIYSDTERVVGVWRDNKPLYARSFHYSFTASSNDYSYDIATLSSDIVVQKIETDRFSRDGIIFNEVICPPSTIFFRYVMDESTHKLGVRVWNSDTDVIDGTVTLLYTKTTDVAGSGNWNTDGVPTVHYSTSEQVIGTWENGKPLYRRIFTTNTMNISTSAGVLYSGSVAIGDYIPDVDQIFVDIGKTYVNVSGVTRGLISASQEGSVIAVYSIVSRSNCTITFTVDYTKVTD